MILESTKKMQDLEDQLDAVESKLVVVYKKLDDSSKAKDEGERFVLSLHKKFWSFFVAHLYVVLCSNYIFDGTN